MTHAVGVNVEKTSQKKCYTFIFLARHKLVPYTVTTNPVNAVFCTETYFAGVDKLCSQFYCFYSILKLLFVA